MATRKRDGRTGGKTGGKTDKSRPGIAPDGRDLGGIRGRSTPSTRASRSC